MKEISDRMTDTYFIEDTKDKISPLEEENKRLADEYNIIINSMDELEKKIKVLEEENKKLQRNYNALASSKLGRLTLLYWYLRSKKEKITIKRMISILKKQRRIIPNISINYYEFKRQLIDGNLSEALKIINNQLKKSPDNELLLNYKMMCNDKLDILNNYNYLKEHTGKQTIQDNKFEDKVLHVLNTSMPYLSNGYSIRSGYIINNQVNIGLKPIVVTRPGFPNDFGKYELNTHEEIIKENIDGVNYYRLSPSMFLRETPTKKYIDTYVDNICKIIDMENPDVVQASSNYTIGLAGLKAARIKGKPFVYEIRGFWEMTTVSKHPDFKNSEEYMMTQKVETFIAENADKVIVISNGLKNELISRGIDSDKITIIPNGVDIEKFYFKDKNQSIINKHDLRNSFIIGYIGSIEKYEGIQTVFKAIKILKSKGYSNIKYVIAGDGDYKDSLVKLANKLDVKENILFIGRIPHEKVVEYYSIFDLCIYHREYEEVTNLVTPLKPLEAMSCEKVVLGSNLDAIKEIIIDEVNGYIVNGQEAELADKIEYIYKNYESIKSIGAKAREWVIDNRSWGNIVMKYNDVYK